jgi:hypothetical protein
MHSVLQTRDLFTSREDFGRTISRHRRRERSVTDNTKDTKDTEKSRILSRLVLLVLLVFQTSGPLQSCLRIQWFRLRRAVFRRFQFSIFVSRLTTSDSSGLAISIP